MNKNILLLSLGLLTATSLFSQNLKDSLLFHYPFDGDMNDMSTKGNAGLVFGPTFSDDAKFGKSILFDGIDDYLTSPANVFDCSAKPFTFCIWVKSNISTITSTSRFNVLQQEDDPNNTAIKGRTIAYAGYDATSTLLAFRTFVGNKALNGIVPVSESTWYHVAITGNPVTKTRKMYINGQLDASDSAIVTSFEASKGALTWGRAKLTASATGTWMNGYLDDAAMFNFELSKDQIALIMAVGVKDFATGIKSNTSASTASVLNNGSRTPVIALSRAANVDIFDITGKMVFSAITTYPNDKITLNNLQSGQYIARINSASSSVALKVLVK